MYNNGDVNLLQNIFEWEFMKTTQKYYQAVDLSRQKIYEAQPHKQGFVLVRKGAVPILGGPLCDIVLWESPTTFKVFTG